MPKTIDYVPLKYDKYSDFHDFCNVITAVIYMVPTNNCALNLEDIWLEYWSRERNIKIFVFHLFSTSKSRRSTSKNISYLLFPLLSLPVYKNNVAFLSPSTNSVFIWRKRVYWTRILEGGEFHKKLMIIKNLSVKVRLKFSVHAKQNKCVPFIMLSA
jgi:hypothetical protein